MNVLFVDDEGAVLDALELALHREPFAVKKALSAEEAMDVLQKEVIDVIVTDEDMPGMRGGDLLALVRWKYPQVTRVLLTGRATLETTIRAVNEGQVYRVLTKPVDTKKLAKVVRDALKLKLMTETTRRIWRGAREQHAALNRFDTDRDRVGSTHPPQSSGNNSALIAKAFMDREPQPYAENVAADATSQRATKTGVDKLLTLREKEVLLAMGAGRGAKEVAQQLGISHHTARNHAKAIYRKLGLHSRGELYVWLNRHLCDTS